MIESRTEMQTRMSEPFGHSKDDRDQNLAYLVLTLMNDIKVVRDAVAKVIEELNGLNGIYEITGFKGRSGELKKCNNAGLGSILLGCDQLLSLTKNKTYTLYAENRFRVEEEKNEKLVKAREFGNAMKRSVNTGSSPPKVAAVQDNLLKRVGAMIQRRKVVAGGLKPEVRKKDIPSVRRPIRNVSRNDSDIARVFTLRDSSIFTIPPPEKDDWCYTIREIVQHLACIPGGKGLKRIAHELHEHNRVLYSSTAIMSHLRNYMHKQILPDEHDFGGNVGRKPMLEVKSICETINAREQSNLSFVGDGFEESKEALTNTRKRRLEDLGMDIYTTDCTPSRGTIARYDRAATLADPEISVVPMESTRKKSVMREVMSRSIRSTMSHTVGNLISGFALGKWRNKPKTLPSGAQEAHTLMEEAIGMEMKPIDGYLICNTDDTGRFVMEGEGTKAVDKRRKIGKTSKRSTKRDVRKSSSLWRRANDSDAFGAGVKCKFKCLISASGHVAPIVLHFYGMPEADLSVPFVVLEVEGLTIGGEVKPGCKDIGYVLLTRSKSKEDQIMNDVTRTEEVMKWYHEDVVIPFSSDLKKMGNAEEEVYLETGALGSEKDQVTSKFRVDSDVSYLNYLRRPETIELNRNNGIDVEKHGAACTENTQSLDVGNCFPTLTSEIDKLTMKDDNSSLKERIIGLLNDCVEFTCRSKQRKNAMIDAVSVAPEAYKKAFTRSKIQDSFAICGTNTRIGKNKFITCPNIDAMIKLCKVDWSPELIQWFKSKVIDATREMIAKGYISEVWFDEHGFRKDTTIDGRDVIKTCTIAQLHLHRRMILNHHHVCNYFEDAREVQIRKKQDRENTRFLIAKDTLRKNKAAELLLQGLRDSWEELEVKDFLKPTIELLEAFVRVRKQEDLLSELVAIPTTKGSIKKVNEEVLADNAKSKYLIQWGFECKDMPVIANCPSTPLQITIAPVAYPSHTHVAERQHEMSPLEITPALVATACANFASLEDKGEEFVIHQKANLLELNPNIFAYVLMSRLPRNLSSRGASIDHIVWKFLYRNAKLGAFIIKLHGCPLCDSALKKQLSKDSLFSNSFKSNLECISGRENSVLDNIDDQVGAYMYDDEHELGIIRAGSAAVGLRKRHKAHVASSHQKAQTDMWSSFYSAYPHPGDDDMGKGTIGNFKQLRQVTGVRFKKAMKTQVNAMFLWDPYTLAMLESKTVQGAESLTEKKHRMACYFFEKLFDLMIGLDVNQSSNAGFETFCGNWNRAQST